MTCRRSSTQQQKSCKSDPRGAAKPLAEADAIIGQINTEIGRLGMSKVVRNEI